MMWDSVEKIGKNWMQGADRVAEWNRKMWSNDSTRRVCVGRKSEFLRCVLEGTWELKALIR